MLGFWMFRVVAVEFGGMQSMGVCGEASRRSEPQAVHPKFADDVRPNSCSKHASHSFASRPSGND